MVNRAQAIDSETNAGVIASAAEQFLAVDTREIGVSGLIMTFPGKIEKLATGKYLSFAPHKRQGEEEASIVMLTATPELSEMVMAMIDRRILEAAAQQGERKEYIPMQLPPSVEKYLSIAYHHSGFITYREGSHFVIAW